MVHTVRVKIPFRGAPAAPLDPALVAPMSTPARPELTGGRRIGVLVQHGFTGNPVSMRPWAEDLAARGYAVEMPLLPGHGTRWQDLNKVTWADWVATVEGAFDKLAAENDAVVAVGLSMGGALCLRLAADHGDGARRHRARQRGGRHAAQGRQAAAGAQARRARRSPASPTTSRSRARTSTATPPPR